MGTQSGIRSYKGATAIVTGAASGIGCALTQDLGARCREVNFRWLYRLSPSLCLYIGQKSLKYVGRGGVGLLGKGA